MGIVSSKRPTLVDWAWSGGGAGPQEAEMVAEDRLAQVQIVDGDILIDAALLGELLDVIPADVPTLMRAHAITSLCERGIDAHQGEFRLSFFYRSRRARLSVDTSGRVLRRSVIDFGQQRLPQTLHRPGD
jgi:hypothetical protein